MFKTQATPLLETNFGVGSIIQGMGSERWLVIHGICENMITLLDLQDFTLSDSEVFAVDPRHLSKTEAREVTLLSKKDYTFTDFQLNAKGLKS